MEIYPNDNIMLLTVCKRPPATLWQILWSTKSLLSNPGGLFSGVLISAISPKAVWCIYIDYTQSWVIAVCKLPSQTKGAIMMTNIWPVIIENIARFWVLLRELDVDNYWSVTKCFLKPHTMCSKEQQSWIQSHLKKTLAFSVSWGERVFPQRICPHGPRTFCSSWVSLNPSRPMPQTDCWSSLPPLHVCRQGPKLAPSALVPCDFRWWVQDQPLPLWSSYPRIPSVSCIRKSTCLSTTWRRTRVCSLL